MPEAASPDTTNPPAAPTPRALLGNPEPLGTVAIPNGLFLPDIDDSDFYALRLLGRHLEPVAHNGEHAFVNPAKPFEPGDFVALLFQDGRGPLVLRLVMPSPVAAGEVLEATNALLPLMLVETLFPRRLLQFRTDKLRAVHKVIGFLKADGTMAELPKPERVRRGH